MAIYGLSNKGRYLEDFQEVFAISGTVTAADVGKAVSLDLTAPKTVKLAADGDVIVGRLEVYEDRQQEDIKLCTVSLKGFNWFPVANGAAAFGIGDNIVGAGGGFVKTATDAHRDKFVQMIDANKGAYGSVFVVY